ncbi:hypothetical protein [Marinobacter sp. CA1]|uniref:hypothetical protein n=1 Tax=Marinobacter sp. CA1 TaxID=2817656 RepID=UPI001D065FD5|nr:hypothetical protein [Marinobacter sp. CA1]UDL04283.1 hypothetical protein J2887_16495 [Marinobacter sp. CA1]
MTRLLPLALSLAVFSLTGCKNESTPPPEDGRDFDSGDYIEPGAYTGTVMNGYLSQARVWLDIDGDGQVTAGPLEITLESGTVVTLENGEPTALSGDNGRFELDTSELQLDATVGPDLAPRDYALYATILPGRTTDQSRGGVVLDKAFMMSAPPGVRLISPLTSLERFRALAGLAGQFEANATLADAFRHSNPRQDYLKAGDDRAYAYARVFARFLAAQFPEGTSEALANGDGTERLLDINAIKVLAVAFIRNAATLVQRVDEAAPAGRYQNVDIDAIELPVEGLDLLNPVVLATEVVFAHSEDGALPASRSGLERSAELAYSYNPAGQLVRIEANGCMAPSMQELARLANAGGEMAATGTQWLPSISASQLSMGYLQEDGVDEVLEIDWATRSARFYTTTDCHPELAATDALDGEPARSYQWSLNAGRVLSITDGERTLVPDYENASETFLGYRLMEDGVELAALDLTGELVSCLDQLDDADQLPPRVVSAQQSYQFSGFEPQPDLFETLLLEFDTRKERQRLLSYSFLDDRLAAVPELDGQAGFRWELFYQSEDGIIEPEQPNLIEQGFLTLHTRPQSCGRNEDSSPGALFARINRGYKRLSEILAGGVN